MNIRPVSSLAGQGLPYVSPDIADQALQAWAANDLYLQGTNWRLKSTGRIAPFNRALKARSVTWEELMAELTKRRVGATGELKSSVHDHHYTLGERQDDKPRFPGDTVLCGSRWPILMNGEQLGWLFSGSAYPGKFTHSLTKLRWAGPRPNDCHNADWHDSGPIPTALDTFNDAIRRAEVIYQWRQDAKV